MDRTTEERINKLLVKCDECKVMCSVKRYREFNCSTAHKGIAVQYIEVTSVVINQMRLRQ